MKSFREWVETADWDSVKQSFFYSYQDICGSICVDALLSINNYLEELRKAILEFEVSGQTLDKSVVMIATRECVGSTLISSLKPYRTSDICSYGIEAKPLNIERDEKLHFLDCFVWESELFTENVEKMLGGAILNIYRAQNGLQDKAYSCSDKTSLFNLDHNEKEILLKIKDLEIEYMEYCRRRELLLFIVNNSKFLCGI